jgi:SAM-dependent methyltransferase
LNNIKNSPTERFSSRVENYIKYRPGYPPDMYNFIINEFDLNEESKIAEIGSGTGLFAEPLLKKGFSLYGVEPNLEMRKAAEKILAGYSGFNSINGTAENTNLLSDFADVISAAQAFHWFDVEKCREEFVRIRKSEDTPVLLIWNERKVLPGFLIAYEKILKKYSSDYSIVDYRNIDKNSLKNEFYGNKDWILKVFDNHQDFDLDSLKGRAFSSSYVPLKGEKGYAEIDKELDEIFKIYNENGIVRFEYDTKLYWGYIWD